jgi:hypothetical protein
MGDRRGNQAVLDAEATMKEPISRRTFVEQTGMSIAAAASLSFGAPAVEIKTKILSLRMSDDGTDVVITDLKRGMEWELDPATRVYRPYREEFYLERADRDTISGKLDLPKRKLGRGTIVESTAAMIRVQFNVPEGKIEYRWKIDDDHLEATLTACPAGVEFVALPGAFYPMRGQAQLALPIYQGVLCRGTEKIWEESHDTGGHTQWSMAMGSVISDKGALLVTQEPITDWVGTRGQSAKGPYFFFEQRKCLISGWYERSVRFYPVDRDITAICKRYRRRVIERGEFVSWQEKIAKKPMVRNLFGALMAFIGYNKTTDIDYVASARRLKAYGFDNVFFYPARMCSYSLNFKMGGDDPIWFSDDEMKKMREIPGVHLSPWGWTFEALDDGSESVHRIFEHNMYDQPVPNWQIENFQWYVVCPPYEIEEVKKRYQTDMASMDWIHYDVVANRPASSCYNKSHALHGNKPMDRRQGFAFVRELMGPATNGNRAVSSEGFCDRLTTSYDIGSTKLKPQSGNAPFIPIPMTMLVFHDSTIHDWWELHNYNANKGWAGDLDVGVGFVGSGKPEKKAAMDALYGCPPNLFPFGKQYGWINIEKRQTFSYIVKLDDDEVQRAIKAAIPVAGLHKKVGMLELKSFEFVTDDYAVQKTVFSDGTEVVANISDTDKVTEKYGTIKANSWRTV